MHLQLRFFDFVPDASIDDDLVCVHLPDFSSFEVGPVMSLLYFGEIWMTETCAAIYQKVLDSLRVKTFFPKTLRGIHKLCYGTDGRLNGHFGIMEGEGVKFGLNGVV